MFVVPQRYLLVVLLFVVGVRLNTRHYLKH